MEFIDYAPYFLWIISIVFLGISSFVIIKKKPLIVNSFWLLITFLIFFTPQLISLFKYYFESPTFIGIIPIIGLLLLIVMFIFTMRGYTVYGVNDSDFQDKLIQLLEENNFNFKQGLTKITIINQEMETTISIQSRLGVSQLRMKGKGDSTIFKNIIKELSKKEIKINYLIPIFYLIFGLLFSIYSIYLILS